MRRFGKYEPVTKGRQPAWARGIQSGGRGLLCALLAVALVPGAFVVSAAASITGAATAAQRWGRAVQIRLPAGIGSNVNADLTAVSCVRTGFCTAAGTYQHGSLANLPLVVTESHRRWGRARRLQLPANAAAQTFTSVNSVACTSASSCVVVGSYTDGAVFGDQLAFLATESHGRWARARQLRLPADAATRPGAEIASVACTGPGSCVAVGSYLRQTNLLPMIATEAGGRWRRAVSIRPPSDSGSRPAAQLTSVTCTNPGSCVAVGQFVAKSRLEHPARAVESHGKWGRMIDAGLPKDASNDIEAAPIAGLDSIACHGPAFCVAIGSYSTDLNIEPLIVTKSAGRWRHAARLTALPAGALPDLSSFTAVACWAAAHCVAMGSYETKQPGTRPMAASESGSTWQRAIRILAPVGSATGAKENAELAAVACTAARTCVAVGGYANASGQFRLMAVKTIP